MTAPRDLRNLPPEVLERLATVVGDDRPGEGARADLDATQRGRIVEARRFFTPELRTDEAGNSIIDGYATVYEYPYDVAGGPPWGWTETIAEDAAKKSVLERDRVGLLINHDSDTALGLPIAATYAGDLDLESDKTGLRMEARVVPSNVVTQFLIDALQGKRADSMSFAFRVIRQEWNTDFTERRIIELKLYDVSVVTYPANPAAVVQLRSDKPSAATAAMPLSVARAAADVLRLRQ